MINRIYLVEVDIDNENFDLKLSKSKLNISFLSDTFKISRDRIND